MVKWGWGNGSIYFVEDRYLMRYTSRDLTELNCVVPIDSRIVVVAYSTGYVEPELWVVVRKDGSLVTVLPNRLVVAKKWFAS